MKSCKAALIDSVVTGKFAGLTTAATVAACGLRESGNAAGPINAVSHIIWGEEAEHADEVSLKYTGTGLALNSAANISWALLYEKLFGEAAEQGSAAAALGGGALVSGIAWLTDFHLVPPRLTPGFEKRLSTRSLIVVYTVLALSLALSSLIRSKARA